MNPYLLKSLEFGPIALESVVSAIPSSRFDERLSEDRFSLREAVAHMVDFEPIFRKRIEDANATPGVIVHSYDEDQMAIDHDYASQDLHANLERLKTERALTAAVVRSLSPSDFKKEMNHSSIGRLAIEDVANFLLAHDLYHLEQAAAYLKA
jgi:uncharacterized damage-inducible protein DinB